MPFPNCRSPFSLQATQPASAPIMLETFARTAPVIPGRSEAEGKGIQSQRAVALDPLPDGFAVAGEDSLGVSAEGSRMRSGVAAESRPRRALRTAAFVLAAAALPALGACQTQKEITGSIFPSDYRERHPIVLADGPRVLDVFVEGPGGLVARGRQDVGDFFAEYRRYGSGPMLAQVPVGQGTNPATRGALGQIREGAGNRLSVSQYQPNDPAVASPIRLTFKRLQAKVGSRCGLWPDDLGVSDAASSSKNEQYWNLGCATQANLASQVADPVDLVRGRAETPPDTGRRMYNFGAIRQGRDPSTAWKQKAVSVNSGISD